MQVLVTFRHMEATDPLRRHAENRIERVCKFLHSPIEAHVVLSVIKHRHIAEVTLVGSHLTANATEETADLYSAIDMAVAKVERQVKKHVTKLKSRKHIAAAAPAAAAPAAAPRASRSKIKTVRVKVDPMSVREAMRRLDGDSADVLIFHNTASDLLTVLHRRKDGTFALIETEGLDA